jgi:hypothetical protein
MQAGACLQSSPEVTGNPSDPANNVTREPVHWSAPEPTPFEFAADTTHHFPDPADCSHRMPGSADSSDRAAILEATLSPTHSTAILRPEPDLLSSRERHLALTQQTSSNMGSGQSSLHLSFQLRDSRGMQQQETPRNIGPVSPQRGSVASSSGSSSGSADSRRFGSPQPRNTFTPTTDRVQVATQAHNEREGSLSSFGGSSFDLPPTGATNVPDSLAPLTTHLLLSYSSFSDLSSRASTDLRSARQRGRALSAGIHPQELPSCIQEGGLSTHRSFSSPFATEHKASLSAAALADSAFPRPPLPYNLPSATQQRNGSPSTTGLLAPPSMASSLQRHFMSPRGAHRWQQQPVTVPMTSHFSQSSSSTEGIELTQAPYTVLAAAFSSAVAWTGMSPEVTRSHGTPAQGVSTPTHAAILPIPQGHPVLSPALNDTPLAGGFHQPNATHLTTPKPTPVPQIQGIAARRALFPPAALAPPDCSGPVTAPEEGSTAGSQFELTPIGGL